MNKKYLLLLIGVIVFFGIFIAFLVSQRTQNKANNQSASIHNNNSSVVQPINKNDSSSLQGKLKPLSGSAQEAAQQFYMYYFATPENPLAVGNFKTNPYLSEYFKENILTGFDNGNIPIFCPQNKNSDVTFGKTVQVYEGKQYMTLVTVSEAPAGTRDLYTITLSNNNGHWLVEDVNCL